MILFKEYFLKTHTSRRLIAKQVALGREIGTFPDINYQSPKNNR